jgi:CBS domain-containing protein
LLLHTEVLARVEKEEIMPIQNAVSIHDVMSTDILTVRPEERIPEAARRLSERNVGAAIVEPETRGSRPGIISERDVLSCVASGRGPEYLHVADLFTPDAMTIPPDSSLQQAAKAMTSDGFRHLVVFDGEKTLGIVSIRDIVSHWSSEGQLPGLGAQIREAMTTEVFAVGLEDTLREAARKMGERGIGAAMVEPAKEGRPPGMISAREVLHSIAAGQDPDTERVTDHLAPRRTFSAPDWSLSQAAEAMTQGGFQHIVVVDGIGIAGILAMRDLMRSLIGS